MYPAQDLKGLAARKLVVRSRLATQRRKIENACIHLSQPLRWIDRALVQWRRISPYAKMAAIPLGLLFKRKFFPRAQFFGSLVRFIPVVLGLIRSRP